MKYTNLIKLLSALLCTVMLFSACFAPSGEPVDTSDTTLGTEATTEPQSTVLDPVDPVLENFFAISEELGPVKLGTAERLDGEYYDGTADNAITVFKKSDIDFLNVQTDTYTVYNANLEKTVLTVSNSYTRGKYAAFDWEEPYINEFIVNGDEKEIPKYPESIVEVHPVSLMGASTVYLIEVRRAIITPIDEEVIEENEGDFYTVQTVYEYYDVEGAKLVECTEAQSHGGVVLGGSMGMDSITLTVLLDATVVHLDPEDGTVVSIINADSEPVRFGYVAETEQYGYCEGIAVGALGIDTTPYVEVYSKKDGTLVLRHYLHACDEYVFTALADGNIFVQYRDVVEEDSGLPYDLATADDLYKIESYIIKVPTGEEIPVACDYVVYQMWNRDAFLRLANEEGHDIEVTENAPNIAIAAKIKDKKLDHYAQQIVVFNNDASVMYAMNKIIPEQTVGFSAMNPFGYTALPNGDYLVELMTPTEYRYAIATKDGVVRSYLNTVTDTPWIAGEFIVYSDGVYDYDMKPVLLFEADEEADSLTREVAIGDHILVSKEVENEETDELERLFFELKKDESGELVLSDALFDGEVVECVETAEDYFVLKNAETGKYTMYNADLAHVLTTANPMNVVKCDEAYLAITQLATATGVVTLYYTIGQ